MADRSTQSVWDQATINDKINSGFKTVKSSSNNFRSGAPSLIPSKNNGHFNIVDEYDWTLTPQNNLARSKAPRIILTEMEIDKSQILNSAMYYYNQGLSLTGLPQFLSEDPSKVYRGLYEGKNTKFWYTIPYFNSENVKIQNNWQSYDITQNVADNVPIVGDLFQASMNVGRFAQELKYPKVGITDLPHFWSSTELIEYTTEFYLHNTREYQEIQKNWEFIFLLSYQNLSNKLSPAAHLVPCMYMVNIPGIRYCPAATLNIEVQNHGSQRMVTIGSADYLRNILVPEAYHVRITISEKIMPTKNTQLEILKTHRKVNVFRGGLEEALLTHVSRTVAAAAFSPLGSLAGAQVAQRLLAGGNP